MGSNQLTYCNGTLLIMKQLGIVYTRTFFFSRSCFSFIFSRSCFSFIFFSRSCFSFIFFSRSASALSSSARAASALPSSAGAASALSSSAGAFSSFFALIFLIYFFQVKNFLFCSRFSRLFESESILK